MGWEEAIAGAATGIGKGLQLNQEYQQTQDLMDKRDLANKQKMADAMPDKLENYEVYGTLKTTNPLLAQQIQDSHTALGGNRWATKFLMEKLAGDNQLSEAITNAGLTHWKNLTNQELTKEKPDEQKILYYDQKLKGADAAANSIKYKNWVSQQDKADQAILMGVLPESQKDTMINYTKNKLNSSGGYTDVEGPDGTIVRMLNKRAAAEQTPRASLSATGVKADPTGSYVVNGRIQTVKKSVAEANGYEPTTPSEHRIQTNMDMNDLAEATNPDSPVSADRRALIVEQHNAHYPDDPVVKVMVDRRFGAAVPTWKRMKDLTDKDMREWTPAQKAERERILNTPTSVVSSAQQSAPSKFRAPDAGAAEGADYRRPATVPTNARIGSDGAWTWMEGVKQKRLNPKTGKMQTLQVN